jgi:hypothetical protein
LPLAIKLQSELADSTSIVSLQQNGVGHDKTCADAILPKGRRLYGNAAQNIEPEAAVV